MKKLLLFTAILAGTSAVNAQTINKDDLKWTVGNMWPSVYNAVGISAIDMTAGIDKTWDFSSYTTGVADTLKVIASNVGDVQITSRLTGDVHYKSLTDNYSLAGVDAYALDNKETGHMGLPHVQGEAWASATTFFFQPQNITGTVISSGSVKIPWGTFNAVLVKEQIAGSINQTTYYWETKEHGRVATFADKDGGRLMIMQSTNFSDGPVGNDDVKANASLNVYPNPASSVINIAGASRGTVKVFNTLGTTVKELAYNGSTTSVDVSGLSKGLYFVQLTSADGVSTQSVVVE